MVCLALQWFIRISGNTFQRLNRTGLKILVAEHDTNGVPGQSSDDELHCMDVQAQLYRHVGRRVLVQLLPIMGCSGELLSISVVWMLACLNINNASSNHQIYLS